MNDSEYKTECDRLSALEAQNHTSWGRWYIDDGLLCTWVCTHKIGFSVVGKLFRYEKSVDELKTKKDRDEFLVLMSEKCWIGQKGMHDLNRAFKFINKRASTLEG